MDQTPTITRVEPRTVEIKKPDFNELPTPAKPLDIPIYYGSDSDGMTLRDYLFAAKLIASMTPHLVKLIYGLIMKSWKTTLGAIIAGIAGILNALGIVTIPADVQIGVLSVALFIVGLFASDEKPTA